jgi:hypothetical protein
MMKQAKPHGLVIGRPRGPAEFKQLGGSDSDHFNQMLANQTLAALWTANSNEEQRNNQYLAATAALIGAKPQDELEGMLISQMIAVHSASMETFRRAMLPEQSFEVWQVQVNAAGKLSRTYATLLEALGRHRGKGQPQVVRVERVTVEAGGQAIVGAVTQGGGAQHKSEDRPHAQAAALAHAPEPALRSPDPLRQPVPLAGGQGTLARPGNTNALRHGRCSHEVLEFRRAVSELLRGSVEKLELV